jgi:hypothetical protein
VISVPIPIMSDMEDRGWWMGDGGSGLGRIG